MNKTDDVTLSSYIDGELDYAQARNLTDQIHNDPDTLKQFVALSTSHMLLQAYGRSEARKAVPIQLRETLNKRRTTSNPFTGKTLLQVAAVLLLFIGSYFLGQQYSTDKAYQSTLIPVIPASLQPAINNVLEYQKSGSTPDWVEVPNGSSARITPIKTFRDAEGKFHRMYLIDFKEKDGSKRLWAMATRIGKENWQTEGVFTNNTPGNI